MNFKSPAPIVKLVKSFSSPFHNVIATARTCYSARGIVPDEEITTAHYEIATGIYQAGHHTTFQHACFQFTVENVSRHCIWSFLHSHPFYNSEQVSQRYVKIKKNRYFIPDLEDEALRLYEETIRLQSDAYGILSENLLADAEAAYFQRFPGRARNKTKYEPDIKKKAQEIARYVMPIATFAYLYHTISGLTLLRYYRLCEQYDVPIEQRVIAQMMIEEVLKVDPTYKIILESPLPIESTPEYQFFQAHESLKDNAEATQGFIQEFDATLAGRCSKLIDWKQNNEGCLADAVREVLGLPTATLTNEAAIDLALNPAQNKLLGETLNLTTHSKLSRTLLHPAYTFRHRLSHTADSQDQRHRLTPASRPILHRHITPRPDYITPGLIARNSSAQACYHTVMEQVWERIFALKQMGVSDEAAYYLLPNAVTVRYTESADLLNLRHKHALRLCYNAQEEIWQSSLEEARQIADVNPRIGAYLLPPCGLRYMAGARPICPEGKRFCGEKVWTYPKTGYQRII